MAVDIGCDVVAGWRPFAEEIGEGRHHVDMADIGIELELDGRAGGAEGGEMGGGGGGYTPRERAPARAAGGAPAGDRPAARGPSWDTPKRSNDLDDDIPF